MSEESRLERWIHASFAVGRIGQDPFGGYVTYQIQAIGRIDVELWGHDEEFGSLSQQQEQDTVDQGLSYYLDLSWLWMLGAYELVRSLDACVRAQLWRPSAQIVDALTRLKRQLAEIRIPLAKFEPAGRSGRSRPGDLVAQPVLVDQSGAGWNVGQSTPRIITRRSLSEALLEFLERARREA